MPSCIMLCCHYESHNMYMFCKQRCWLFQNYMDKRWLHFLVYGYYRIVVNVLKISIDFLWVNGTLVFFKLTLNIHFSPLFNYNAPIVICHMFLDILKISWYIKKKSIESYHACTNIARVKFFSSKYMDKGLPHFYVYGYCKMIVNISKNINTLLTHCMTNVIDTNIEHDHIINGVYSHGFSIMTL